MKITLIKPKIGHREDGPYIDEGRMEPLPLGVLAGLAPPDVEVVMIDDRFETIPYDDPTDLVAITVETFTAKRAYEISAEYRKRDVLVIMGGMHPTLLPEEVRSHADSIYLGDAEFLWRQVIEDVRNGKMQPIYRAEVGPPQPGTLTRRDIFKGKKYLPITLLQFSRGCRFECTFCATSAFFNKSHYYRRIEEVVAEIESQSRKILFFVDDNLLSNQWADKTLFRELIPLQIRWVSQASIDMTEDLELMDLMAQSGCLGNVVGFESIEEANLTSMKKSSNLIAFNHYKHQLDVIRDYGLQTWAAFTLGHEYDTRETAMRTLDFAMQNKFAFAAFNILLPYPNTPLYRQLEREQRLLYDGKWWLHPDYRFNYAAFKPRLISADELTEACFVARSRFNSIGSIIRRALDVKTNMSSLYRLGIYLNYNPLFRREVFKKHGMRFGEQQRGQRKAVQQSSS